MSFRYPKGGFIQYFFDPLTQEKLVLYGWGNNNFGNIGVGNPAYRSSPVQIGSDTTWTSTASNSGFTTLALKIDGSLWSWGRNFYGTLGQNDTIYRSSPVQIGALTTWSKVFAANNNCYAIKNDGTLWVWGRNEGGSLGLNDTVSRSSPIQLGSETWSNIGGVDTTSAGIRTNGTLWTWGQNSEGALGSNVSLSTVRRSSPVQIGSDTDWSQVIGGTYNFLALKTTGALFTWGWNLYGALGLNDQANRSSPTQIGALTTWLSIPNANVYLGQAVIKNDRTLWSWGSNAYGQLGQNDRVYRSSPVQVGALTTWMQVSSSYTGITALRTDGTMWSWGINPSGQLGLNDTISRSSPTQVGSDTNWASICGSNAFMLALKRIP